MKNLILRLNVVVALLLAGPALAAADDMTTGTQTPAESPVTNAPPITDEQLAPPEAGAGQPAAEQESAAPAPAETSAPDETPAMAEKQQTAPDMAPEGEPAAASGAAAAPAPESAATSAPTAPAGMAMHQKTLPPVSDKRYDRQTILKERDSKTLDLRYCLDLGDNVAIAKCAGE